MCRAAVSELMHLRYIKRRLDCSLAVSEAVNCGRLGVRAVYHCVSSSKIDSLFSLLAGSLRRTRREGGLLLVVGEAEIFLAPV